MFIPVLSAPPSDLTFISRFYSEAVAHSYVVIYWLLTTWPADSDSTGWYSAPLNEAAPKNQAFFLFVCLT